MSKWGRVHRFCCSEKVRDIDVAMWRYVMESLS